MSKVLLSSGETSLVNRVTNTVENPVDSKWLMGQVIPGGHQWGDKYGDTALDRDGGYPCAVISYDNGLGQAQVGTQGQLHHHLSPNAYFRDILRYDAKGIFEKHHTHEPIQTAAAEITAFLSLAREEIVGYKTYPNRAYVEPPKPKRGFLEVFGLKPAENPDASAPTVPKTITEPDYSKQPLYGPDGERLVRWTYTVPYTIDYDDSIRHDDDKLLLDGSTPDAPLTYRTLLEAGGLRGPWSSVGYQLVTAVIDERTARDLHELTLGKPAVSRLIAWTIGSQIITKVYAGTESRFRTFFELPERWPKTPSNLGMRVIYGDAMRGSDPIQHMKTVRVGGDTVEV